MKYKSKAKKGGGHGNPKTSSRHKKSTASLTSTTSLNLSLIPDDIKELLFTDSQEEIVNSGENVSSKTSLIPNGHSSLIPPIHAVSHKRRISFNLAGNSSTFFKTTDHPCRIQKVTYIYGKSGSPSPSSSVENLDMRESQLRSILVKEGSRSKRSREIPAGNPIVSSTITALVTSEKWKQNFKPQIVKPTENTSAKVAIQYHHEKEDENEEFFECELDGSISPSSESSSLEELVVDMEKLTALEATEPLSLEQEIDLIFAEPDAAERRKLTRAYVNSQNLPKADAVQLTLAIAAELSRRTSAAASKPSKGSPSALPSIQKCDSKLDLQEKTTATSPLHSLHPVIQSSSANSDALFIPRFDFYQNASCIILTVYRKAAAQVQVRFHDTFLTIHIQECKSLHVELAHTIVPPLCTYKILPVKLEIVLGKLISGRHWSSLGNVKWEPPPKASDELSLPVPTSDSNASKLKAVYLSSLSAQEDAVSDVSISTQPKSEALEEEASTAAISLDILEVPKSSLPPIRTSIIPLGIDNPGIDCYMISIIQCLHSIPVFSDYLTSDAYLNDIRNDPTKPRGRFVKLFARLLKVLKDTKRPYGLLNELKGELSKNWFAYSPWEQQDSQEFLLYVLDTIHEDVNQILKKPYIELNDYDDSTPDDVIATEYWAAHVARNDSFIVNHFQGQYKSRIQCDVCANTSVKFEPFMNLTLEIPETFSFGFLLIKLGSADPVHFDIHLEMEMNLADLYKELSRRISIPETNFVTVTAKDLFIFPKATLAQSITEPIYIFEKIRDMSFVFLRHQSVDTDTGAKEDLRLPTIVCLEPSTYTMTQFISKLVYAFVADKIVWVNELNGKSIAPFTLVDPNSRSAFEPKHLPRSFRRNAALKLDVIWSNSRGEIGGTRDETEDRDIIQRVKRSSPFSLHRYPPQPPSSHTYMYSPFSTPTSSSSRPTFNLQDCFAKHVREECISDWYCNRCKTHTSGRKTLSLWRLPRVLIIHIKRFAYRRGGWMKSLALVSYPKHFGFAEDWTLRWRDGASANTAHEGHDKDQEASKHTTDEDNSEEEEECFTDCMDSLPTPGQVNGSLGGRNGTESVSEDVRRQDPLAHLIPPHRQYQLLAVSNHLGSATNGHYTAFCKRRAVVPLGEEDVGHENAEDSNKHRNERPTSNLVKVETKSRHHWYMFDDDLVTPIPQDAEATLRMHSQSAPPSSTPKPTRPPPIKFGLNIKRKAEGSLSNTVSTVPALAASTRGITLASHSSARQNVDHLRTLQVQQEALAQDATIFDYDSTAAATTSGKDDRSDPKKPRYMENLIKAAQRRRLELERATERSLQREREASGLDVTSERFVTGAYRRRQEELLAAEAEEASRAKQQEGRGSVDGGSGMNAFYRNVLEMKTRGPIRLGAGGVKVADLVPATALPSDVVSRLPSPSSNYGESVGAKREDNALKAVERDGKEDARGGVMLNDSNEVVDKRMLLKGGLNVKTKPPRITNKEVVSTGGDLRSLGLGGKGREERSRMAPPHPRAQDWIMEQEMRRQGMEEGRAKERLDGVATTLASRNTSDASVADARARYLARKAAL